MWVGHGKGQGECTSGQHGACHRGAGWDGRDSPQQLPDFPLCFAIDFLRKSAGNITNGDHVIVGHLAMLVSTNSLTNSQITWLYGCWNTKTGHNHYSFSAILTWNGCYGHRSILELLMKMTELANMAKLTFFIRKKSKITFSGDWNPLLTFRWKRKRKMNLWFMGLNIRKGNLWKEENYDVI